MGKFCDLDKNIKHIGEVATGHVDGKPSGAVIDTSTNEVTGEERETLTGLLKNMSTSFDTQLSSQSEQFQDRFNTLAPIKWTPNTEIKANQSLQVFERDGLFYLPNVKKLPFTTGAVFNADNWVFSELMTQMKHWRDVGDVRGWGAKGDGVTDDTTSIQSAINESNRVYLPKGVYLTSAPLIINSDGSYNATISIEGSGQNLSIINKVGNKTSGLHVIHAPTSPDPIAMDVDAVIIVTTPTGQYAQGVRARDITLLGDDSTNVHKFGFYAPLTSKMRLIDMYIQDCGTGFRTNDSWITTIDNVTVRDCVNGFDWVRAGNTVSGTGTSLIMSNCNVLRPTNKAYTFVNLTYSTLTNVSIDLLGTCNTGIQFDSCRGITVNSPATEAATYTNAWIDCVNQSQVVISSPFEYDLSNGANGTSLLQARNGSSLTVNSAYLNVNNKSNTGSYPLNALGGSNIIVTNSQNDIADWTGREPIAQDTSTIKASYNGKDVVWTANRNNQEIQNKFEHNLVSTGSVALPSNGSVTALGYIDWVQSGFSGGFTVDIDGMFFANQSTEVFGMVRATDFVPVYTQSNSNVRYNVVRTSQAEQTNFDQSITDGYKITVTHSDTGNANRIHLWANTTDGMGGILNYKINPVSVVNLTFIPSN